MSVIFNTGLPSTNAFITNPLKRSFKLCHVSGKALGIFQDHIRHEGHIPRTLLPLMEEEGVIEQNADTKKWKLK